MQTKFSVLILIFAFLLASCAIVATVYGEVDKTCTVARVIDGDTFRLHSGELVRLADVDCPEYNESGYSEATDYLTDLINGEFVYLDIDDLSGTDSYDRLVCVVYVEYNSTHCINVNEALIANGYAVEWDHSDNEFNPSTWSMYVPTEVIPEFPSFLVLPLLMTAVAVLALFYKKKVSKPILL